MPDRRVIPIDASAATHVPMTRRRTLQWMAAAMALAGGGCVRAPRERIVPWVDMPEAGTNGAPLYYATAWVRDGHAHGVLVGTREGRPIKVEGNPSHPSSLGATDAQTQASILDLWDPDRAQVVRQRLEADPAASPGTRTEPQAAASTWSAFEGAWRAREARLRRDGGAGLRILASPFTSPTLHAQLDELLARYPNARWHRHAPFDAVAARAGARLAFARDVETVLHLERARVVATFDADPFSSGPGRVRHALDWTMQRRAALGEAQANVVDDSAATTDSRAAAGGATAVRAPSGKAGSPALTLAVETTPGLFGARADARLALAPAAIEALLWRVAARLQRDLAGATLPSAPDAATARFEARLVDALRSRGPDSVLIAGPHLSAPTHALVHLLNHRLGAYGRTLDAITPLEVSERAGMLVELVEAMQGGAVDTLLILDANPVYDAPGDVPFAAALARVPFSVRFGLHHDETARLCSWSLPATHAYEQWSDALAHDGTATVVQPAIAPLYDARSVHDLLGWLAGGGTSDGHAHVQRTWRARATGRGGGDFDAFWRDSLRRGVIAGSASTPLALRDAALPPPATFAASPAATGGTRALVAVFVEDPSAGTGAQANNAWLQELPRPFTKITWDNALLIGPATARALGVETGDVVVVDAGHARVTAPACVQAAHAEGAVSLPLGYGRRAAGRVGNDVGYDAYALREIRGGPVAVRLERTGQTHAFAVTQREMSQHGRELARTVARGGRIEDRDAAQPSLYPPVAPGDHRWAMVIDLDACIGCNACTIACQAENSIPVVGAEEVARGRHMHWLRIDRYDAPGDASIFQPVPCMHCENAPCELVCPVGATVHDSEGLNVQVYNRCIGTRFCSNNCPYKVRRFNFLQYAGETTESLKAQRNPDVTVRQRGVMEKCTYCLQRISRARLHVEDRGTPLTDGDVVTACQAACPTRAIRFGDLNDPAADVVRAKGSPRHYAMLGELNTRPRTTYLARVAPEGEGT